MAAPAITFCPPMPAYQLLKPEPIFAFRRSFPVSAEAAGHGEFTSPGISYEDFSRMNTSRRSVDGGRRTKPPAWAVNDWMLREVIVRYVEQRAFRKPQRLSKGTGTLAERLARAEAKLVATVPAKLKVLHRLNEEYIVASDERREELVPIILGLDSTILIDQKAAAVAAGVVYMYYRSTEVSVGVGSNLGIHPVTVRQILHRIGKIAKTMTFTEPTISDEEMIQAFLTRKAPDEPVAEPKLRKLPRPKPSKEPKLCSICGEPCPTLPLNRKICTRPECRVARRNAANATYDAAKRKARRSFCSDVCREVAKHPPVTPAPTRTTEQFGVTMEEAKRSSFGDDSYESYLEVAARSGVDPMKEEVWLQVR